MNKVVYILPGLALGLMLMALASAAGPIPRAATQESVTVAVGDFFFCSATLGPGACQTVIRAGDSVRWDYSTGTEGHTVTHCGDSCDAPTSSPLFESGPMAPSDTFTFTFGSPGTYLYYCRFHPQAMRATIVVQPRAVSTTTPAPSPILTPTPAATPTPSPVVSLAPTATPVVGDDNGISAWWFVVGGVGGGIVLLAGAGLLSRRLRAGRP